MKNIKGLWLCAVLVIFAINCFAQKTANTNSYTTKNLPYWVSKPPIAGEGKYYYYRVTRAEGENYEKAYAKAFAMAILESSWKLGVAVTTNNDLQTLENNITENINVVESQMRLPLNKVCEYSEKLTGSMGIRIYILWQVAKFGNVSPQFDDFNACE